MKQPGEQPQTHTQDDTDPQRSRGSKRKLALKVGATVAAGALAVSLGAGAREIAEPHVIDGNAQMSPEAMKDSMVYFKSNERNARIGDEATRYADMIIRDMNNHPERIKFFEDSETDDNNDNAKGQGAILDTVKTDNGDTYSFTLMTSQHGGIVETNNIVMVHSTNEKGVKVDTGVTFTTQGTEEVWSTQISQSHNDRYDGTLAAVNPTVAERPEQTGEALQEADNQAIMAAQQYLKAAKVGE